MPAPLSGVARRAFARRGLLAVLLLAAVAGAGAVADAAPISLNCQAGCTLQGIPGDPGAALWTTDTIQPSGTGVFKPFLRMQADGQATDEDGHNTDANGANDEKGGIWTHSVLMSDLDNVVSLGGIDYYEFMLDLGEPAEIDKSLLSLDQFKICTGNAGNLTQLNDCPTAPYHYDMDAGGDRAVLLDYNLFGGGNGNSDLFVYIPKSALAAAAGDYFYLYTAFGYLNGYQAEGTFEEWAFQSRVAAAEPGSLTLFAVGLFVLGRKVARRRRA